jgi:hypothetical protein
LAHFWNKDRFDALAEVSGHLRESEHAELFPDYIAYLDLRKQGVRKAALAAANRFVDSYASDPFEIRQRICSHLIEISERYWWDWPSVESWLIPGNLSSRLFVPTWREWRERSPKEVRAWIYDFGHQSGLQPGHEVAFLTEPADPRSQYAYIKLHDKYLDYVLHELWGTGYILCSASDFKETLLGLKAAANAMGDNLNPAVIAYFKWLDQLASALDESVGEYQKLPEILEIRNIPRAPVTAVPGYREWFITLPEPLRT